MSCRNATGCDAVRDGTIDEEVMMKELLLAIVAVVVVAVSGCASYGGAGTNNALNSGTQPEQEPFSSQVVGP